MEIDSSVLYAGTLSTASNFILEELGRNRNAPIQCLPIDDCISLMWMSVLEIISKVFKQAIQLKVQKASYTGIIVVYKEIKQTYGNQSIICQVIEFLETNRVSLTNEKLNHYVDKCIERQCLIQLQNQESDIHYFQQLEKNILAS